MAIHEGNILIPFGFQDTTAYLLTIPINWFESEILKGKNTTKIGKQFNTPVLFKDFISTPTDQHVNSDAALRPC